MSRSLILLAHGSPDARHADGVHRIADRVRRKLGPVWTVSTSYLQHHGPTVADAFRTARQSHDPAVAIQPLLLTAGEHWRDDVPAFTKEITAEPWVELLEPLAPLDLRAAVLEVLAAPEDSGATAEPTDNATLTNQPPIPSDSVVLVAGGSRIQNLRRHFESLADEVQRLLGPGSPEQDEARAQPIQVDLLTRPAEIGKLRSSGPTTWIVPLLVSRGRVYDAIVSAADQIEATVTHPVGEATAFASEIVARARNRRSA